MCVYMCVRAQALLLATFHRCVVWDGRGRGGEEGGCLSDGQAPIRIGPTLVRDHTHQLVQHTAYGQYVNILTFL
jgi:hypothetical protein